MVIAIFLILVAMVMMLMAVLMVLRARRLDQIEKVNERLNALAFKMPDTSPIATPPAPGWMTSLTVWLTRVGLQMSPTTALALLAAVLLGGVFVLRQYGTVAAILWWLFTLTAGVFVPQVRYAQKINKMVSQIPLFIDQVIRGLVTGRNVEGAIKLAVEDTQEPLLTVMQRAQRNAELGADLGDALRDAASFYDVKELHMMGLAVHTSRVYGGSPREMLESVVALIRQREQAQRELRAMTGETRVTAWVLGFTPLLTAGFMYWSNPATFDPMLHSEGGRFALMVAGGMLAMGGLALWRMIKSI